MCLFRFKAKITEPSPHYAQWLAKQRTVEDIINFANDFTYVSDKNQFNKVDYWQTPSEFFISKKGDCEDIHFFIADAIYRALGLESYLIVAWRFTRFPMSEAHAMAIYKDNDQIGCHLINYKRIIPMSGLKDITAVKQTGYNQIKAVFKIPEGKKV